ncbi:MAG TPA: antibiotic biosynthesis monooxygenase, partial [Chloroflexota bacterium]
MALVAIAERRVVPGRAAAYLAALRAFSQTLAFVEGRGEMRAVVDDADPDHVLVMGRWTSQADFEGAMPRLPAGLVAAAESHVRGDVGPVRWYRIAREIERMAVRPGYVVARRYTIPLESSERFELWVVDTMHRLFDLPGVVSQTMLVELDDPTQVVSLIQYTSPDAGRAADQRAAARPLPPDLGAIADQRFAGRTDSLWEA